MNTLGWDRRGMSLGVWVWAISTFGACFGYTLYTDAQERRKPSKIYSVIISNNSSQDEDIPALRYADDDGARYWELFSAISDKSTLLANFDRESRRVFSGLENVSVPPTREAVLRTLRDVQKSIQADRDEGYNTTLFVVFTGHGAVTSSGMGYLSLQDGRITREDLQRELIHPEVAHRTHLIIDACNAYYMVQARNGKGSKTAPRTQQDPFEAFLDRSRQGAQPSSVGVFLSTAGAAEVHEWSRFQAGVFSHQLRSGILGAADANNDLRITYRELEAWLAAANASVEHPTARINVYARGPSRDQDAVLLDLSRLQKTTLLEIDPKHAGRYTIEDSRGVRYADFHTAPDATIRLALLWDPLWRAPYYYVRTEDQEARVAPNSGQGGPVAVAGLTFARRADRPRGSVDEAYRKGLFKIPFGPSFVAGYQAALQRVSEATPELQAPDSASLEFGGRIGWIASPEVFNLDTLAQGVQATADVWLYPSWSLQFFADYRTSATSAQGTEREAFRLHRLAFGVGSAWRSFLYRGIYFEADLKTGHQWLIHSSATQSRADTLAWRLESGASLGVRFGPGLELALRFGPSLDVLTLDGEESLEIAPHGGLQLGTRW